jgi:hypothetical protein
MELNQAFVDAYFGQRSGGKKIIVHVNQHHIKHNAKNGTNLPLFTVKMDGRTLYAWSVIKTGPSCLEPHINDPLACGARAYDTTYSPVLLLDEDNKIFPGITFTEARARFGSEFADMSDNVCPALAAV